MQKNHQPEPFDYIVIGSGFGGSVSAMRLAEKGYRVLVLERGKRYRPSDFPRTNWYFWKYLWLPALRCFGILQVSPFQDVLVMHGCGVGGGSLGYASVLMKPDEALFEAPAWKRLADWKTILSPHYETASHMLGVARNPRLGPADEVLRDIAAELGMEHTFQPTMVGIYFGEPGSEGQETPDPFFGGQGPARTSCNYCGGCMVGCRHNAKNTLDKNYLYFAEKWGAKVRAEAEVRDVRPVGEQSPDGPRYEVVYRSATALLSRPEQRVRARNIVFSAGALGTLGLLFRCRDITGSLPGISPRLGDAVRTNSEALLGTVARDSGTDYSQGVAITSIFHADGVTAIEPVRYPAGSDLMRYLSGPLIEKGDSLPARILQTALQILAHPVDFLRTHLIPGWAKRTIILLVMQTEDNRLRLRLGRSPFTLFRRALVSSSDQDQPIPCKIEIGHQVTLDCAERIGGIPAGTINEGLLNIPMTAHILGGCPFGRDAQEGVVGLDCQVHNYPGLYVVDGSIVPGNPGVNPALTITALAEYAMSRIPAKEGAPARPPLGVSAALHHPQADAPAVQFSK